MKSILRSILLFSFSLLSIEVHAQDWRDFDESPTFKGLVVYSEWYGNSSPTISVNAEYNVFKIGKWYANARGGLGYFKTNDFTTKSIPVGMMFFNRMGKSHLEVGLGISYTKGIPSSARYEEGSKALYFIPSLGYRFQKPTGGFVFRFTFAPFFKMKEFSDPDTYGYSGYGNKKRYQTVGLSAGYFFARKKQHEN